MGTSGHGILQDDIAHDVHADYLAHFNTGQSHDEILKLVVAEYADFVTDEDYATNFWLAVAQAQWDCGVLAPEILSKVEAIVREETDLKRWGKLGKSAPVERRRVLDRFLKKIRTPKLRPKKPRKGVKRNPIFSTGDCLSIRLSDGDYGAAIVLGCPKEQDRIDGETLGINVIGQLRYKSVCKPTLEIFERREWLHLTHHGWLHVYLEDQHWVIGIRAGGFRGVRDRFEVVGKTIIRDTDPKHSPTITGWDFPEQMVHQARWDAGDRGPNNVPSAD